MKPIIGLTMACGNGRDSLAHVYMEAVDAAGGIPVLLPNSGSCEGLSAIHGLVLTGGGDFDPAGRRA